MFAQDSYTLMEGNRKKQVPTSNTTIEGIRQENSTLYWRLSFKIPITYYPFQVFCHLRYMIADPVTEFL